MSFKLVIAIPSIGPHPLEIIINPEQKNEIHVFMLSANTAKAKMMIYPSKK